MIWFWSILAIYCAVGVVFLLRSASRGFVADMMFALLWPVYLIQYWVKGY